MTSRKQHLPDTKELKHILTHRAVTACIRPAQVQTDAKELSVFCQSYFNKTLIGQAGSIGGKARQEVEVEQRDQEYSGKQEAPSTIPTQITIEETCELTAEKGTKPYG